MNRTKEIAVRTNEIQMTYATDALSEALRLQMREFIAKLAFEEMTAVVGARPHERTDTRRGYRHGSEPREITTSFGKAQFHMPRAKLFVDNGGEVEWQSTIIPRYSRRCRQVDAALLGLYFGGVNTRKIKQALRPMLRNAPISKSTVSRLIVQLKEYFEAWRKRSLVGQIMRYVYFDGICVRVRCGKRIESLPVLAAVGVRPNGEKVLLTLDLCGAESTQAWKSLIEDLSARGLRAPRLAIIDGNPGLTRALAETWPKTERQRCAVHKLRNLLEHAPKRLYDEIRQDFHAIVYADSYVLAGAAYDAFLRKWRRQCEGVARSLEEAGMELLTFYRYPQSQWKSLRTTNVIERINGEFRRRIKSQGSFPSEQSVLVMLFGLVASGMIRLRRIVGYEDMAQSYEPLEIMPSESREMEVTQLTAA
jgi:transposase-like protein